jgi:hypothetical protein
MDMVGLGLVPRQFAGRHVHTLLSWWGLLWVAFFCQQRTSFKIGEPCHPLSISGTL